MTDTTTPNLPDGLVDYLAARDRERADAVTRVLAAMTDRERALFREAAIMGYVQGKMFGREGAVPDGRVIVSGIVDGCVSMPDLYPTVGRIAEESEGEK